MVGPPAFAHRLRGQRHVRAGRNQFPHNTCKRAVRHERAEGVAGLLTRDRLGDGFGVVADAEQEAGASAAHEVDAAEVQSGH